MDAICNSFITKYNNTLFGNISYKKSHKETNFHELQIDYYNAWQDNMTGITKCDSYYKVRCNLGYFLKFLIIDDH